MKTILSSLPQNISTQLRQMTLQMESYLEEIRIRINRPLEIIVNGKPYFLSYVVKEDDAFHFLNKISQFSIYTIEEELRRGYITIDGGHRVGLAGKVILENGHVKSINKISSFNIRIAREKIGVANELIPLLFNKTWQHTIIIGPPQTGKTTLLRDIARIISTGCSKNNIEPLKVGIVDERSEIAGSVGGIPQLTFGTRVDVLDGCPKAEGMMMLIRSMSPDVIIVDEVGRKEDAEAIMEAVNAGVIIMTTMHGTSLTEISKRPIIKKIIDQGVFQRFVELNRSSGPGTITNIKDSNGRKIANKVSVT